MSFNNGFMCAVCGPVREFIKKTISKVPRECCKECGGIVKKWSRPLNERDGRCRNCGAASFNLAIYKRDIARHCRTCDEVYNIDKQMVLRPGKEALKYGSS
jgi:hypothetical protein